MEKIPNYEEVNVKLRNTQLNKLNSAAKNKTGTILIINKKNFQDEELTHELFLTTTKTTKIRNAFANIMSAGIKLRKAQIYTIIQSGGFLRNILGNLGRKVVTDLAVPLARDDLRWLVRNLASNVINRF